MLAYGKYNGGQRSCPPKVPARNLFLVNEVSTAVLLPARFIRLGAERSFLAEADHMNSAGGYSTLD